MGAIFTKNRIGRAIGFDTDGQASPARMGVSNNERAQAGLLRKAASAVWRYNGVGVGLRATGQALGGIKEYIWDTPAAFWGDGGVGGHGKDTTEQRKKHLMSQGDAESPMEQSLVEALANGRWGFVSHVEGGFDESAQVRWNTPEKSLTAVAERGMGRWSIQGVAFVDVCEGGTTHRHGVEGPLYWYYHNRSSNTSAGTPFSINLRFGQTILHECFVVGLDIKPQNLDYNLWAWTIHLAVNPDYRPKPLSFSHQTTRQTSLDRIGNNMPKSASEWASTMGESALRQATAGVPGVNRTNHGTWEVDPLFTQ